MRCSAKGGMTRQRKTIDCGKADTVQHQHRVSLGDRSSGCLRACTHKSGSVIDVRFTPDATKLLRSSEMDAMCQKLPSATSFDHLVGAGEQRGRHLDAACFGSLEIHRSISPESAPAGRRVSRPSGYRGATHDNREPYRPHRAARRLSRVGPPILYLRDPAACRSPRPLVEDDAASRLQSSWSWYRLGLQTSVQR